MGNLLDEALKKLQAQSAEEQAGAEADVAEHPQFPACRDRYRHLAEESVDEEIDTGLPTEE